MQYKGYYAIPQYSANDKCFHGKLLGITDVITFEGATVEELEQEFQSVVDEYIEFCQKHGKQPKQPFSGNFNLRLGPELHARVAGAAQKEEKSINQFIKDTLSRTVN